MKTEINTHGLPDEDINHAILGAFNFLMQGTEEEQKEMYKKLPGFISTVQQHLDLVHSLYPKGRNT